MKSKFNKILSGILMISLVAGCGTKELSTSSGSTSTSNIVNSEQYKNNLDVANYSNLTLEITEESGVIVDYRRTNIISSKEVLFDNGKMYYETNSVSSYIFDKEKAMETLEITSEADFKIEMEATADELGGELIDNGNEYKILMDSSQEKMYIVSNDSDTYFEYYYNDEEEVYSKRKEIGKFVDYASEMFGSFLFPNSYSDAKYDETEKRYYLDSQVLPKYYETFSEDSEGMDIKVYYYFENGNIVKAELESTYPLSTDFIITTSYVYNYKNRGTTSVTIPSGNNVYECSHDCGSFTESDDNYHIIRCEDCGSVITYGKHTFGADECSECGYFPTRVEYLTITGLAEGFEVEVTYNELNNEIVDLYFYYDYVEEISDDTWKYTIEDEESYITITSTFEEITDECLEKEIIVYNFYGIDGAALRDSITIIEYYESHNYIETAEENKGNCIIEYTYTCEDCGDSYTVEFEEHEYTYTIDENYEGTLICENCELSLDGEFNIGNYGDEHCVSFHSGDTWIDFYEDHTYVDGECICGAIE